MEIDQEARRIADARGPVESAWDLAVRPAHHQVARFNAQGRILVLALALGAIAGADPRRIAVGGDSAGGNLAASVAIDLKDDPAYRIVFQLLLYPGIWPDEETKSRRELDGPVLTKAAIAWFDKCLAALSHPHAHRAMLGRAKDLKGVAPALIVTAGFDPLKDEGRDYAARLNAAGVKATHVEYPSLVHDFYVMPDVSPAVAEAVAETAAVLKAALK